MKLSANTRNILKNFAAINPNMVFDSGSVISTISEAKSILAEATIAETFKSRFGIYDLNEFLSVLSLFDDPDLEFAEDSVTISEGKNSVRYFYADIASLTYPQKKVSMPKCELEVDLTDDTLERIKRAASVLGHATLEISGNKGVITATVSDLKNSSANRYSIELDSKNACKEKFSFIIVIGNLKMLPGAYKLSVSSKLVSNFKHAEGHAQYWVALDKNSTFGS